MQEHPGDLKGILVSDDGEQKMGACLELLVQENLKNMLSMFQILAMNRRSIGLRKIM